MAERRIEAAVGNTGEAGRVSVEDAGVKTVVRFELGMRCEGCGMVDMPVDERTRLCPACWGLRWKVENRVQRLRENLERTLQQKFALPGAGIRER
jgi:hypothetical protein